VRRISASMSSILAGNVFAEKARLALARQFRKLSEVRLLQNMKKEEVERRTSIERERISHGAFPHTCAQ
jgi:hypothetical protein